jgi:hypothetical protein
VCEERACDHLVNAFVLLWALRDVSAIEGHDSGDSTADITARSVAILFEVDKGTDSEKEGISRSVICFRVDGGERRRWKVTCRSPRGLRILIL